MLQADNVFLVTIVWYSALVWRYLFTVRKMPLSIPVVFYEVLIE